MIFSRARVRPALSLRSKFLLTVVVAIVVPLATIGLWLTSTASRAGEELLRGQLTASLEQVAADVSSRWVYRRSDLLLLAHNEAVQQVFRRRAVPVPEEDAAALEYLHGAYVGLLPDIDEVAYRDADGALRWTLAASATQGPQVEGAPSGSSGSVMSAVADLPVVLEILDHLDGERLGTLEARVRLSSLLPPASERAGPVGSMLAVVDGSTGNPLLLPESAPPLLSSGRFDAEGARWLAVEKRLSEPAIDLYLAAPLDPYSLPFEHAARRGLLALIGVAVGGLILAAILTRRLTRSLGDLAEAADAVSSGELDRRVEIGGRDEVGRVAEAFNTMTESLRRTLRELSHRQALAAVGEFASELAHEIRNPLTAVRIDLQRVEERLPEDQRLRRALSRALAGVERLDRTVAGSLRVARSGRIRREPLDLRSVLEQAVHSAEPEFRRCGASLEWEPGAFDGLILHGDASALEQAFLNLLLNAAQALGEGGRVQIRAEKVGERVTVAVHDSGPGIPPDTLERVFEPFFSTKPEGTGLGLAVARRIAEAHGGEIRIESAPAAGTTVSVFLTPSPPPRRWA